MRHLDSAWDMIRCVRLGPEDASELAALERLCFTLPWSEEIVRAAFGQPAFMAYGLRRERELLAYVSFYHMADELEILNIAVRPEYRGQGLGKRLLGLILRGAEKMGIVRSVLEVRPGNAAAIALYASYGYEQAGRRPGYYTDTGEDALIYSLAFPLTRSLS